MPEAETDRVQISNQNNETKNVRAQGTDATKSSGHHTAQIQEKIPICVACPSNYLKRKKTTLSHFVRGSTSLFFWLAKVNSPRSDAPLAAWLPLKQSHHSFLRSSPPTGTHKQKIERRSKLTREIKR